MLAEAATCLCVEGRHFFPPDSLRREYLQPSTTHRLGSRQGAASYFHVEVNGKRVPDAAWFYSDPPEHRYLKDHVVFSTVVAIES